MATDDLPLPRLLEGEQLLTVQEFPPVELKRIPSSLEELEHLASAANKEQVGDFGPVLAAEPVSPHHHARAFERYKAVFGRDSLRVALDLLDRFPKLARSTLLELARLQGVGINDNSEEEPGRIVHEVRDPATDPVARELTRQRGWNWPYYGSVDATPEFVRLLAAYCRRTTEGTAVLRATYVGRDSQMLTMANALERAVNWIIGRIDANHEGLLEFKRRNPYSIENQVWKDSWDAYFHADGTMANHDRGIASIEVQRVAYDALLDAAELYEHHLKKRRAAIDLRERAERLRTMIMEFFWIEERGGYFILGSDRDDRGQLRRLKVRTSNMGHLLHSRLLMGDHAEIVRRRELLIKQLFGPTLLCLNGIRTLASDEMRFRPGAYHNGSCWGWDNYIIAQGLKLHGYVALADYLEQLLLEGTAYTRRYVEFLRGDNDPEHRINTRIVDAWDVVNHRVNRLEQPPQDMQAWTAAAVLAIKLEREHRPYSRMAVDPQTRQLERRILGALAEQHQAATLSA